MIDSQPGDVIGGKYRIVRRLGVGGTGMVYLARVEGPAGFEKLVALKVMHDHLSQDRARMEEFLSEARITARLNHPNIAQVFELGGGADGSDFFLAMEFIAGKDLRSVMFTAAGRDARLPVGLACYIVAKLAEALDYAHRLEDGAGKPLKLVHRDVSPVNCLLSIHGEVKLIDFGIAKVANSAQLTSAGMIKGKTAYMSPEQVQGLPLDRRSDLFALGCTLYELLCGLRPFDGDTEVETLKNILLGQYAQPRQVDPEVPEPLEQIIVRCLEPDPARRFQWTSELQDALQGYLVSTGTFVTNRDVAALLADLFPKEADVQAAGGSQPEPQLTAPAGDVPATTSGQTTLSTRLRPRLANSALLATQEDLPAAEPTRAARPPPSGRRSRELPPPFEARPPPRGRLAAAALILVALLGIAVVAANRMAGMRAAPVEPVAAIAPPAPPAGGAAPAARPSDELNRPAAPAAEVPPAPTATHDAAAPASTSAAPARVASAPADRAIPAARRHEGAGGLAPASAHTSPPRIDAAKAKSEGAPSSSAPMAYVDVTANRTSEVYVDGAKVGTTPLRGFALRAGRREVRVDCIYPFGTVKGDPRVVDLPAEAEATITHECRDTAAPVRGGH